VGNVSEIQEAKNWIYDKLAANSDITSVVSTRIYADTYPGAFSTRTFPYILYNLMAATDIDGLGTVRVITSALFQVRAVDEPGRSGFSWDNFKLVDKRIDDVLQVQVTQLSGDFYFSSRREGAIDRAEYAADNTRFHNLGGLYRVWIGKTP
jgi:hypothetical protein